MKPKRPPQEIRQRDLFRVELSNIINHKHELIKLSKLVDWNRIDEVFRSIYCLDKGRPGVSTRLMVTLHYLKYRYHLSDENVVKGWVENPYWQYLSGMIFFEHRPPIDPSSMTRWRQRMDKAGAEELVKKTIKAGLNLNHSFS